MLSKEFILQGLAESIPVEYLPTVNSMLSVERLYGTPEARADLEVQLNVKAKEDGRCSSFLRATKDLHVEETQVSERFGLWLLSQGLAKPGTWR